MEKLTLSVDETARLLGVSRSLCFSLVREGRIPAIRLGRRIVVLKSALLAFLERETRSAVGDER